MPDGEKARLRIQTAAHSREAVADNAAPAHILGNHARRAGLGCRLRRSILRRVKDEKNSDTAAKNFSKNLLYKKMLRALNARYGEVQNGYAAVLRFFQRMRFGRL